MKEGFFEWIADATQIVEFVDIASRVCLSSTFEESDDVKSIADLRVLEIGCGTSTLAETLSAQGYGDVIAIDNDAGCIEHMKAQFANRNSRVEYYVYDMVEDHSGDVTRHNALDDLQSFQLIIDKGTFDAILVEGSVTGLIHNVLRLLAVHGVYVLFSINSLTMLEELFQYTPLGLHTVYSSTRVFSNQTISIMLLKKDFNSILSWQELEDHQREVMDIIFQVEKPFLDDNSESRIREQFALQDGHSVPLAEAYRILFSNRPDLGYDYDLFLEDLQNISLKHPQRMSLEEALNFVQMMQ